LDDLVHFALREWSRLSFNVSEAEVERAKAQLKASILLSLDGTTAVAEDIGRQIITTGRRLSAEDIERAVGQITAKDVMDFAQQKLWYVSSLPPLSSHVQRADFSTGIKMLLSVP
jgi:processing peptidase subunit beta